ncbi:porin [Herbaspirillum hiltneri N3]|uniref:Porin n=1 Tax=Herbaspirillum hiltneri N3 TaxID=1262470 RepID=A0ABN4HZY2_9BURK|nr:porin [Herbaspirillum hiltneri]AKZ63344.1 porin [Herbaspirillum hiltneri N3]
MKKTYLALAVAALAGTSISALAQSNVTIYGIVDTSIRYVSNDNAQGNSNLRMDNGAISNSRLGFKGVEDLGGGLKAEFRLENGFNSDTGALANGAGVLFGRQSWVGLSGSFGKVSVGRQNTPLFDLMADHFDPLTVGNYESNAWLPAAATRIRSNNTLRYDGQFGPVAASVSYAFGEQAGSARSGSQVSTALRYNAGGFAIGGGFQQTVDTLAAKNKATTYNLSASYDFGVAKVFGGYFRLKDATGLNAAFMATTSYSTANTLGGNVAGVERKDDGYFAGATFNATTALALTGAFYYDKSKNVAYTGLGNVGNGKRYAVVGVAEYALSKRTQLYTTVDYNKAKDAAVYEITNSTTGKNSLTTVGVGIRHIF